MELPLPRSIVTGYQSCDHSLILLGSTKVMIAMQDDFMSG